MTDLNQAVVVLTGATGGFGQELIRQLLQAGSRLILTAVYPFFSRTPILQSERYGTLAQGESGIPEHLVTDPAQVMEKTIKAIRRNQLHVFPDRMANIIHLLKQYFPRFYDWISDQFT